MTRILLIEDNRDLAYGLRNNLEIEGYDVEVAHDGVAGLKVFSNVKPDLVILDIMLPQLDGFRVLKALPCDIFLGAHGAYFDLERKYPQKNFVDPEGYKKFVVDKEKAFKDELAKQQ